MFRCAPHAKVPPKGSHGFKDATANYEQVLAWWGESRDANIGLATGAASGILVIDLDVKDDCNGIDACAKLETILGPLPKTRSATSGSGGRHLYFKMPGGIPIRSFAGGPGRFPKE